MGISEAHAVTCLIHSVLAAGFWQSRKQLSKDKQYLLCMLHSVTIFSKTLFCNFSFREYVLMITSFENTWREAQDLGYDCCGGNSAVNERNGGRMNPGGGRC